MAESIGKYLNDILVAAVEIDEETTNRGRSFEALCNDRVYRKFVERKISIIGEAMNNALKRDPNLSITSARRIVDTRNLVVHSYDSIDNEIIWAIIIRHLPILRKEVLLILESLAEADSVD